VKAFSGFVTEQLINYKGCYNPGYQEFLFRALPPIPCSGGDTHVDMAFDYDRTPCQDLLYLLTASDIREIQYAGSHF
jgi:hypothetical protein